MDYKSLAEEVKDEIDTAKSITIVSHINPDADTLGTTLGIYALLHKDKTKRVEIVNYSDALPRYLDFLPFYSKIKKSIDYDDSLIIICDCGSLDRAGFDLSGRTIINIDHHNSNTLYGKINIIDAKAASASQVAYSLFKYLYTIEKGVATCFYTALVSDTQYFTTLNMNKNVFSLVNEWISMGVKIDEVAFNFNQRKSLSSIRILSKALDSLVLYNNGRISLIAVTKVDIESTGATMPDLEGIVNYALSLVTVEIAIYIMELDDGMRVSIRSKGLDISKVALSFNGGGHKMASGFTLYENNLQISIEKIINKIIELGLIDETK